MDLRCKLFGHTVNKEDAEHHGRLEIRPADETGRIYAAVIVDCSRCCESIQVARVRCYELETVSKPSEPPPPAPKEDISPQPFKADELSNDQLLMAALEKLFGLGFGKQAQQLEFPSYHTVSMAVQPKALKPKRKYNFAARPWTIMEDSYLSKSKRSAKLMAEVLGRPASEVVARRKLLARRAKIKKASDESLVPWGGGQDDVKS